MLFVLAVTVTTPFRRPATQCLRVSRRLTVLVVQVTSGTGATAVRLGARVGNPAG